MTITTRTSLNLDALGVLTGAAGAAVEKLKNQNDSIEASGECDETYRDLAQTYVVVAGLLQYVGTQINSVLDQNKEKTE